MDVAVLKHGEAATQRWLHIQNTKKLAKLVKEAAVVVYMQALDGLCRAAGYAHYDEALHHPRPLLISFENWRANIEREFGWEDVGAIPREELVTWFDRIFVNRGWAAAQQRQTRPQDRENAVDAQARVASARDDLVPAAANHERTIVDSIAKKPFRRHT